MHTEELTIRVDREAAEIYRSASEEQRRKYDILLSLLIREAMQSRQRLEELMDQMSREAQERGLTPEILQEILSQRDER